MSPIIRATTATLAGILNTFSTLSGGSNGPAVTDFNNKSINILPPLHGLYKVGVTPLSIDDYDHHNFPLCDVSNDEIPDAACRHPRKVMTSLFYPACPPSDNQKKPVLLDEQHFAPVFTPSVLGNISHSVARGPTALHNLMSQAVHQAPSCKGQYPMVIFAPTAGGQRQAYTQAASELASRGHVVLTVDYPYLSGAVENQSDETVQLSTFGDWITPDEALLIQTKDLQFVYNLLVNEEQPLSGLPFWTNDTTVQIDACIFGHGTGGKVARVMVETHMVKCGGPLEGILTLPAPFNREQTAANSEPAVDNTRPSVPYSASYRIPQIKSLDLSPPTLHGAIQLLKHLRDSALNTLGLLVCSAEGTCGTPNPSKRAPVQKRSIGDDPWYYPKKPYYKEPCEDYGYEDNKDKYGSGCYDDDWDGDYDDHYEDDYDDYYDPCEDYDPCDRYDGPYKPSKPFPPPGIFPPNITWPPYGDGKIPDYNRPWDDHWDDYRNDGGEYGRKYGHKGCGYYDGGYDDGYEGYYDDDYRCDHRPDHYREWDKKHHCHGHVDDHDDDYYDHDDDDYDDDDDDDEGHDEDDYDEGDYDEGDYDEDEDDYDEGDYDEGDYDEGDYDEGDYDEHDGDCQKKHHHHGHVDDHDDKYKGDDHGYDHGYVDDWDNEDRV
ncbi:paf acetylhydrolase family protein [Diaporthe eres]|uniref:1-alkyl-2-acetylglycerophosphocholine esterase n=1 Tax=Diaporthe vaccinii TaxID=105482 RepID=A0ABR4DWG3_9PEZI|nr:paf acetylhydrolase family protein [Diaporthe eres]